MNWVNLEMRTLRSPEYIGSAPVERATWLNLLAYCCAQENGGRLVGAAAWKDRQWQQVCGVTGREVRKATRLIAIEGDDVLVFAYPTEKEDEVRARREAGREGGLRSGEARARAKLEGSCASSSASRALRSDASTEGEGERERKEKGKEGEREREPAPAPVPCAPEAQRSGAGDAAPSLEQAVSFAPAAGVAPRIAEIWWHECDGRPRAPDGSFTDSKGQTINRWRSALRAYAMKWQSNDLQRTSHGNHHPKTASRNTGTLNDCRDHGELPDRFRRQRS